MNVNVMSLKLKRGVKMNRDKILVSNIIGKNNHHNNFLEQNVQYINRKFIPLYNVEVSSKIYQNSTENYIYIKMEVI